MGAGMIENSMASQSNPANATGRFVMGAQSSPIPMLLIDGTEGHKILTANSSFLRMFGRDDCHIVGQPLATALNTLLDAQKIEYVIERLSLNQPGTWEIDAKRLDGVITSISIVDCPLPVMGLAQPQHVLSFYMPGVEASQTRLSIEELRAAYTHAPGFIATTEGADHRLTFANDSFKKYVGKRQLEGLTVIEAMPETVAQGFIELLDHVFATGIPYHGKSVPYEFPDAETGEWKRNYGDFVYAAVRDANSNIVGLFCEGYDITKQKEAEAAVANLKTQVAHASRVNAMGTMATTLAHELNQPLTAILNFVTGGLRLLEHPGADIDVIRQAMLSIQESSERAASVIRTLRDLTDRRVRASTEFQLKLVVTEALNLVRNGCSVNTILYADIDPDLMIRGDRVQIQQVIINLVRNGCDAVAGVEEQKVYVTAHAMNDEVVVCVRDTGPGVAAESAQDIFTWVNSSKETGMGLGLSICRTIVEAHGGRIWLEDSSNAGSEFRFAIPATLHALS